MVVKSSAVPVHLPNQKMMANLSPTTMALSSSLLDNVMYYFNSERFSQVFRRAFSDACANKIRS